MTAPHTCPKCAGRMTEGFVADEGYGSRTVSRWFAGAPVKSIWTGIKTRGLANLRIVTHRCGRCGLMENYTPGA